MCLFAAWAWITLHFSYSKGERAGYIQKISQKGWVCKTWEGELAMSTFPGTAPQIFTFSVRDDAVAQKIQDAAGQLSPYPTSNTKAYQPPVSAKPSTSSSPSEP